MTGAVLTALLALSGCGGAAAPPPTAPASGAGQSTSAEVRAAPRADGLLPAGIYFRHHAYDSCSDDDDCEPPTAAIAAIVATPDEAERLVDRIGSLGPGYPMVVHTDELGPADASLSGIAVIGGLYATIAEARAAATADLPSIELAPSEEAFARLYPGTDERRLRVVVRISEGPPAVAYAQADLDRLVARFEREADGASDWLDRYVSELRPACRLDPGRIFVADAADLDDMLGWYAWAPVRCGEAPARVRWTDTLVASTVRVRADGTVVIRQVTSVECDRAFVEAWRYDRSGRHPL